MKSMSPVHRLPDQLRNHKYRFYLAHNKIPVQPSWNSTTNYRYDELELASWHGNYGLVCGIGGIIVLDFDNMELYEKVVSQLPPTFTVQSASRKLPHMYYVLEGPMMKKDSIHDSTGKTLLDVQADRSGVIGAGSRIGLDEYTVMKDIPIATILHDTLRSVFGIMPKMPGERQSFPENKEVEARTRCILAYCNIKPTTHSLYQCPFHAMHGNGNLNIMEGSGHLWCFHENRRWNPINFMYAVAHHRADDKLHYVASIIQQELRSAK